MTTAFHVLVTVWSLTRCILADRTASGRDPCSFANGGCSHYCVRAEVGRVCRCDVGYSLSEDGVTCIANSEPLRENFLLVADSDKDHLYQLNAETGEVRVILPSQPIIHTPVSVVYNPVTETIYWSDVMRDEIRVVALDGSPSAALIHLPGSGIEGLALDCERNLLYFSETQTDSIHVMSTYDTESRALISSGLRGPRAVLLDLTNRYVYWTDVVSHPRSSPPSRIERASAEDGGQRTPIIDTRLVWPNALTADFREGRLFWADAYLDKIEMSDMSGNNREVLVTLPGAHLFALTCHESSLFFTDWNKPGVQQYSRPSGQVRTFGPQEFHKLNGITYYGSTSNVSRVSPSWRHAMSTVSTSSRHAVSTGSTTNPDINTTSNPTTTTKETVINPVTKVTTATNTVHERTNRTKKVNTTSPKIWSFADLKDGSVLLLAALVVVGVVLLAVGTINGVVCYKRYSYRHSNVELRHRAHPVHHEPSYLMPIRSTGNFALSFERRLESVVYDEIRDVNLQNRRITINECFDTSM